MKDVRLSGYIPGAIGRIAELHGTYYYKHWGFHLFFESKVAIELSEFLRRFNEAHNGFWVASVEEKIVGSIAIDGVNHDSQGAHLRARGMASGRCYLKKPSNFAERRSLAESISGLLRVSIQRAIFMKNLGSSFARNVKASNGEEQSLSKSSNLSSDDFIEKNSTTKGCDRI
jgi:hypothetical protein